MARNSSLNLNPRDVAAIDLGRVLERLEKRILGADADPRLLHSNFERTKTVANLEYARTLLLRLEHSSSSIKLPSKKQAAQSDLFAQRALIKRLSERMHELETQGDDDDLINGPEDEEDILREESAPETTIQSQPKPPDIQPPSTTEPTSTLRNRLHPTPNPSTSTPQNPKFDKPTSLLENNDTESANLTSSLVSLAQALKAQSTQFSASLATDTETLNRASEGLDKNTTGMEAAGQRMGLLKRMSEGKGWWGRIMLYAWIAGLWVFAILLVFAGPKLRF
ncbi:hypothetical protein ACLMJK_006449 [Lecanora helva]